MIEALRDLTYIVRHNPNCPKPFEVRLCGQAPVVAIPSIYSHIEDGWAARNDVGYGKTADEAAANALAAAARRRGAKLFRQLWDGL